MDKLLLLKTFAVVVSEGSFTKAADKLGSSNQLVSNWKNSLIRAYLIAQQEKFTSLRLGSSACNTQIIFLKA